jgi:putative tryptophan/tyrosine transport system substrate-binding protein
MQRRQFISLFGGIAAGLTWPLSSSAQKPNIRRIGVLVVGNADADAVTFQTELREELRKSGYVEGQNLIFELRSAEQKIDLLPKLAAELVAQQVDVIVALYTPCALAAWSESCGDLPAACRCDHRVRSKRPVKFL